MVRPNEVHDCGLDELLEGDRTDKIDLEDTEIFAATVLFSKVPEIRDKAQNELDSIWGVPVEVASEAGRGLIYVYMRFGEERKYFFLGCHDQIWPGEDVQLDAEETGTDSEFDEYDDAFVAYRLEKTL